jgi:hypothetical protein
MKRKVFFKVEATPESCDFPEIAEITSSEKQIFNTGIRILWVIISVMETVKRVFAAATVPSVIFPDEVYMTDIIGAIDESRVLVESTELTMVEISFPKRE